MHDEHDTPQEPKTDEDVEGHGIRVKFDTADTPQDVEGHAYKSGRGLAETPQDVDAHAMRGKRSDDGPPAEGEERLAVPDADDDVEAHRRKFR